METSRGFGLQRKHVASGGNTAAQLQQRVSFFLKYNQTALHIQAGSSCPGHSAEGSQESAVRRNCGELAAVSESTAALRHNGASGAQPSHIPHRVHFSLNSPATCYSWAWELKRLGSSRKNSELLIVPLCSGSGKEKCQRPSVQVTVLEGNEVSKAQHKIVLNS